MPCCATRQNLGNGEASAPEQKSFEFGLLRNYETLRTALHTEQSVGTKQRRSTKFCPCSLSRLVTLRMASHDRLPKPILTGKLVGLRPPGREVALC